MSNIPHHLDLIYNSVARADWERRHQDNSALINRMRQDAPPVQPYTSAEFANELGPETNWMGIVAVQREAIDDIPAIVIYFEGIRRGVVLDRQFANELTQALGPHPLVEDFFRLN